MGVQRIIDQANGQTIKPALGWLNYDATGDGLSNLVWNRYICEIFHRMVYKHVSGGGYQTMLSQIMVNAGWIGNQI